MDSFQFWLYVIIGVVYLISRMRKKGVGQAEEQPDSDPTGAPGRDPKPARRDMPKALTFEDLLREITAGKVVEAPSTVVDYDDDLVDEEQNLEDVDSDYQKENKTYERYEAAKKQAFERPSLEETLKLQDTDVRFGRFGEFESAQTKSLSAEFLKDLRNRDSLKRAVVLSEILKTKF